MISEMTNIVTSLAENMNDPFDGLDTLANSLSPGSDETKFITVCSISRVLSTVFPHLHSSVHRLRARTFSFVHLEHFL